MADGVLLSYNSNVCHFENSAVISCTLWGLCDLAVCWISLGQFSELKNRNYTCLSNCLQKRCLWCLLPVLEATDELLWWPHFFLTTWLHSNWLHHSSLDLTRILLVLHFASVFIFYIDTILISFINLIISLVKNSWLQRQRFGQFQELKLL